MIFFFGLGILERLKVFFLVFGLIVMMMFCVFEFMEKRYLLVVVLRILRIVILLMFMIIFCGLLLRVSVVICCLKI